MQSWGLRPTGDATTQRASFLWKSQPQGSALIHPWLILEGGKGVKCPLGSTALQDAAKPLFESLWSFTFLLNCLDKISSHSPLHLTLNLVRYNLQLIIAQTFLASHYDLLIHLTLSLPIWIRGKMVSSTFDPAEVGPLSHYGHEESKQPCGRQQRQKWIHVQL